MAVEYASPSRDAQAVAYKGFQQIVRFAPNGVTGADGTLILPATDVTLSAPHRVHAVELERLAARQPLTESTVAGWRFLVLTEYGAVASVEVSAAGAGKPSVLEQVNVGPYVRSTASALQELDENPEVRSGRYEPHMLKVPALGTFLLWLRQLDGNDHLFTVLSPAPDFLETGRIYREDELLGALEGPTQRAFDVSLGGADGPVTGN
jgi:hypothetical protein